METPTLIVADDHPALCAGLKLILTSLGCRCVAEPYTGPATLEALREFRPFLSFIDVQMPGLSGLEVLAEAVGEGIPTHNIIMSGDVDVELVEEALSLGAKGVLLKTANGVTLQAAVSTVCDGGVYLGPAVQAVLAQNLRKRANADVPILTGRENEILLLTAGGMTAPQISGQLIIEEATVKKHLQNIYRKLDAHNKASAVKKAIDLGLLNERRGAGDRRTRSSDD